MIFQAMDDGGGVRDVIAEAREGLREGLPGKGTAEVEGIRPEKPLQPAREVGQAVWVVEGHHEDAARLQHAMELAERDLDEPPLRKVIQGRVGDYDVAGVSSEG